MSTLAIVIPADSQKRCRLERIENELADLQRHVGGLIESAPLSVDTATLWINGDGDRLGLPVNSRADALWSELRGGGARPRLRGDVIVGDAILHGGGTDDGEMTDVSEAWLIRFGWHPAIAQSMTAAEAPTFAGRQCFTPEVFTITGLPL